MNNGKFISCDTGKVIDSNEVMANLNNWMEVVKKGEFQDHALRVYRGYSHNQVVFNINRTNFGVHVLIEELTADFEHSFTHCDADVNARTAFDSIYNIMLNIKNLSDDSYNEFSDLDD